MRRDDPGKRVIARGSADTRSGSLFRPLRWLVWIGLVTLAIGLAGPRLWGMLAATSIQPAVTEEAPRLDAASLPIEATLGSIESVLVLDGVVAAVSPHPVITDRDGSIREIAVDEGDTVGAGDLVATLDLVDSETGEASRLATIQAPITGVVTEVAASVGAEVAAGQTLVTIAPELFEMVAPVEPSLLYRLYQEPERIVVAIDHGPAPFECPFRSLGSTDPTDPFEAAVELRCEIPSDVRVFPGVRGKMGVTTGRVDDAVLVPVSAVIGEADTGIVVVVGDDGAREQRTVSLGLTDGVMVQVTDGLKLGEAVLDLPDAGTGGSA